MTQPTLREEFVSWINEFKEKLPNEYDLADWWLVRFQAQLEVLAEEVAKIKNPYTKDHDTDVLIGIRNGVLGEVISLIRTFSKELK